MIKRQVLKGIQKDFEQFFNCKFVSQIDRKLFEQEAKQRQKTSLKLLPQKSEFANKPVSILHRGSFFSTIFWDVS